jgi:hypothetical protein
MLTKHDLEGCFCYAPVELGLGGDYELMQRLGHPIQNKNYKMFLFRTVLIGLKTLLAK